MDHTIQHFFKIIQTCIIMQTIHKLKNTKKTKNLHNYSIKIMQRVFAAIYAIYKNCFEILLQQITM